MIGTVEQLFQMYIILSTLQHLQSISADFRVWHLLAVQFDGLHFPMFHSPVLFFALTKLSSPVRCLSRNPTKQSVGARLDCNSHEAKTDYNRVHKKWDQAAGGSLLFRSLSEISADEPEPDWMLNSLLALIACKLLLTFSFMLASMLMHFYCISFRTSFCQKKLEIKMNLGISQCHWNIKWAQLRCSVMEKRMRLKISTVTFQMGGGFVFIWQSQLHHSPCGDVCEKWALGT